jgi:RNA polymerase sigma factor (TIGR02999 family)
MSTPPKHEFYAPYMSDVTQILSAVEQGDPQAAEQLLPLVYEELRKLARQKMAQEATGQTMQATALVHEAYLRLVDKDKVLRWNSRGHFFAAAAEAMRRILVDNARRKKSQKHGGDYLPIELKAVALASPARSDDLLLLDDALAALEREDAAAAQVAKLRLFAGLSVEQAAKALALSRAAAYRHWTYARAWLHTQLREDADPAAPKES